MQAAIRPRNPSRLMPCDSDIKRTVRGPKFGGQCPTGTRQRHTSPHHDDEGHLHGRMKVLSATVQISCKAKTNYVVVRLKEGASRYLQLGILQVWVDLCKSDVAFGFDRFSIRFWFTRW